MTEPVLLNRLSVSRHLESLHTSTSVPGHTTNLAVPPHKCTKCKERKVLAPVFGSIRDLPLTNGPRGVRRSGAIVLYLDATAAERRMRNACTLNGSRGGPHARGRTV